MADQFNITHTELRSVKLIFFLIYNELKFGFSKGGLKAQCSTQPRASEATPWVSRVGAVAP